MIRTAVLALLTTVLTLATLSREGVHLPELEAKGSPRAVASSALEPDGVQELRSTPEHPFWVEGKGFVAAEAIRVGDRGLDAEGNAVVFMSVEISDERARHYNLEVEDFHTYFVSETAQDPGVWVHNTCGDDLLEAAGGPTWRADQQLRHKFKTKRGKPNKIAALQRQYPDDGVLIPSKRKPARLAKIRELAEARVARGGGQVVEDFSGSGQRAVKYEDGHVTWVFRETGEFWSMRVNPNYAH